MSQPPPWYRFWNASVLGPHPGSLGPVSWKDFDAAGSSGQAAVPLSIVSRVSPSAWSLSTGQVSGDSGAASVSAHSPLCGGGLRARGPGLISIWSPGPLGARA
ncbi:uncharacterized protein LOC102972414 [Panthera tigris]|uniref:uncharacterized protein LOC102972414 n=1 Tax=Panthera tigris TaxID=9694 RepID=UPI001C6FC215|nr:uncharacterized protein LOC102972414 [Panthera tigris]